MPDICRCSCPFNGQRQPQLNETGQGRC
jgi:hypothetical protein